MAMREAVGATVPKLTKTPRFCEYGDTAHPGLSLATALLQPMTDIFFVILSIILLICWTE